MDAYSHIIDNDWVESNHPLPIHGDITFQISFFRFAQTSNMKKIRNETRQPDVAECAYP